MWCRLKFFDVVELLGRSLWHVNDERGPKAADGLNLIN